MNLLSIVRKGMRYWGHFQLANHWIDSLDKDPVPDQARARVDAVVMDSNGPSKDTAWHLTMKNRLAGAFAPVPLVPIPLSMSGSELELAKHRNEVATRLNQSIAVLGDFTRSYLNLVPFIQDSQLSAAERKATAGERAAICERIYALQRLTLHYTPDPGDPGGDGYWDLVFRLSPNVVKIVKEGNQVVCDFRGRYFNFRLPVPHVEVTCADSRSRWLDEMFWAVAQSEPFQYGFVTPVHVVL